MARPSPSVSRTVAVVSHLARQPERPLTLSELARALGLNKATAHALLSELSDAGWLVRDGATKAFTLGPALVAIGNASVLANPATRLAMPVMTALAAECGVEVVASALMGDEIVLVSKAGTPRPFGVHAQPGQHLPFVPPLGSIYVAWSGDDAIERWLDKLGPEAGASTRDEHVAALASVREHGYSVGLGQAVERGRTGYVLTDFTDAAYVVHHIGAPVFDAAGTVVLGLFLVGFAGATATADITRFAGLLTQATGEISRALDAR